MCDRADFWESVHFSTIGSEGQLLSWLGVRARVLVCVCLLIEWMSWSVIEMRLRQTGGLLVGQSRRAGSTTQCSLCECCEIKTCNRARSTVLFVRSCPLIVHDESIFRMIFSSVGQRGKAHLMMIVNICPWSVCCAVCTPSHHWLTSPPYYECLQSVPSSISHPLEALWRAWQQTHRRPATRTWSGRVAWVCDKEGG